MSIAVFPGSFDPITLGHVDIIERAVLLFDKIIIGIGNNSTKNYMFTASKREEWIKKVFEKNSKIEVLIYNGLTVEFCRKVNAKCIVRGLRQSGDFEFEQSIAQMNKALASDIETVFIPCQPRFVAVASSIVRDIIQHGGDAGIFLPEAVRV
ncbi:MAG: pantetheine-phosphate adenylyltransferase [Bacteroidia bacterium]